jgi:type IV pilus assembly protein PilM
MDFRISAEKALGADINGLEAKTAHLSWENGLPKIEKLEDYSLENSTSNTLHPLRNLGDSLLVTAIPTNSLLVRPLNLKLTDNKDIDSVLRFQVEPLLPYPIEEALIDRMVLSPKANSTALTIFAIQNSTLQKHIESMHSLRLEPEAISSVPAALAALGEYFSPSEKPRFVIHTEAQHSICALVHEGKLLASHYLNTGYLHFINALTEDTGISIEEAQESLEDVLEGKEFSQEKNPNLWALSKKFDQEATRAIQSISIVSGSDTEEQTLLTGEYSFIALSKKGIEPYHLPEKYKKFAVAIGLALGHLPNIDSPLNFRQGTFAYPNPWKRVKSKVLTLGSLCLFLAGATYLLSQLLLGQQRDQITDSYLHSLSLMGHSHEFVEEQLYSAVEPRNPKTFNSNALSKRLKYLEKRIGNPTESFPLEPDVPLVCEFIHWLNTHPLITSSLETDPNSFQINRLHYSMVSHPSPSSTSSSYRLKIELDFKTNSPQFARKFRESLLQESSFLDTQSNVSWSAGNEKYQTIFFLKNQKRGS